MVFLFPEGKGWLAPPLKTFHLAPERGSRASRAPPPPPPNPPPKKDFFFYFGRDVSKVEVSQDIRQQSMAKADAMESSTL